MATILNDVFKKIETFLIEDCKRHIRRLNMNEMKQLQPILLNCRTGKHLGEKKLSIFIKFVKVAFGISTVRISETEAIELYSTLYKCLKINEP